MPDPSNSTNFGYLLEKELDFDDEHIIPPPPAPAPAREYPARLISRGDPPAPNLSRLHTIERMLENLDRSHGHSHSGAMPSSRGYGPLPPHPHAGIPSHMGVLPQTKRVPSTQREHRLMEGEGGGWMYPEHLPEMRQQQPEMYRPSAHQLASGRQYQMGSRSSANNWAVEMERRRVMELQQMQLKERLERERMQHNLGPPAPPKVHVG